MSEAFHDILESLDTSCQPREKARRSQVKPITDAKGQKKKSAKPNYFPPYKKKHASNQYIGQTIIFIYVYMLNVTEGASQQNKL